MSGATSAQLAYGTGQGPAGAKLLHDIANQIFGSTTLDTDAYRWWLDPKLNTILVSDRTGRRRFYWEHLEGGAVAIVDHASGRKTTYPAGSLLAQLIPKTIKRTHQPCEPPPPVMPPPAEVPADIRRMYAVYKTFAEAVFDCTPEQVPECGLSIDPKYPGQVCLRDPASGESRRVELRSNGTLAVHCEQSGKPHILPRKVTKLMTKKRNGRGRMSYFAMLLEIGKDFTRPALH